MTYEQIQDHIAKATAGAVSLAQNTRQERGPVTTQPARHVAIAVTHLEDAAMRLENARACVALHQAHDEDR